MYGERREGHVGEPPFGLFRWAKGSRCTMRRIRAHRSGHAERRHIPPSLYEFPQRRGRLIRQFRVLAPNHRRVGVQGPEVWTLFPVPCCVLFAHRDDRSKEAPLPTQVRQVEGNLPRRDIVEAEAAGNLTEAIAPWPAEASDEGRSHYRIAFRQGRNPRVSALRASWNRFRRPCMLPADPAFALVRMSARQPGQEAMEDRRAGARTDREHVFCVRPCWANRSLHFPGCIAPLQAVIPWNEERSELMDSGKAASRVFLFLAEWLERAEALVE